jgi:hypothetical protein
VLEQIGSIVPVVITKVATNTRTTKIEHHTTRVSHQEDIYIRIYMLLVVLRSFSFWIVVVAILFLSLVAPYYSVVYIDPRSPPSIAASVANHHLPKMSGKIQQYVEKECINPRLLHSLHTLLISIVLSPSLLFQQLLLLLLPINTTKKSLPKVS